MRVRNLVEPLYKPSTRLLYPLGLYNLGVVAISGIIGGFDMPLQDIYQGVSYFNAVTGSMALAIATGNDILRRNRNSRQNSF